MSFILDIAVDYSHQSSKSTDTTKGDVYSKKQWLPTIIECLIFYFVCKLVIHFYAYNMLINLLCGKNDHFNLLGKVFFSSWYDQKLIFVNLNVFHLNSILLLMIKRNTKQLLWTVISTLLPFTGPLWRLFVNIWRWKALIITKITWKERKPVKSEKFYFIWKLFTEINSDYIE